MKWLITWGESSWSDSDLTGEHLVLMQLGVNKGWSLMPTEGPIQLISTIAALVAVAEQRPFDEVCAEVRKAGAQQLLEALTLE
jgi:hypothetical protein